MKSIKVAIIGTGSISALHTESYLQNDSSEVLAVCDVNSERAKDYAEKYGISLVYDDYRELLKNEELDAVSVTTWNSSHAAISIDALNAGKAVLCEKPIAMNAIEATEMVSTADRTKNLLMVGFVRRFEELPNMLKDSIEQGRFGDIYYSKAGYLRKWGNPGGWFSDKSRSGGGPVIDLGVHVIDLVRYITGNPKATSISASTFNSLGMLPDIRGKSKYYSRDYNPENPLNDVEDGAFSLIRFDNGMTLSFETSWTLHVRENHNYLHLFGDKGGVQMEPEFEIYGIDNNMFTLTKPDISSSSNSFKDIFQREIDHFIECIQGVCECRCPATDGLAIMEILDAIYMSAKEKREVIIR